MRSSWHSHPGWEGLGCRGRRWEGKAPGQHSGMLKKGSAQFSWKEDSGRRREKQPWKSTWELIRRNLRAGATSQTQWCWVSACWAVDLGPRKALPLAVL